MLRKTDEYPNGYFFVLTQIINLTNMPAITVNEEHSDSESYSYQNLNQFLQQTFPARSAHILICSVGKSVQTIGKF